MKTLPLLGLLLLSGCRGRGEVPGDTGAGWGGRAQRLGGDAGLGGPRAEGTAGDFALYTGQVVAVVDEVAEDPGWGVPLQHHHAPTGGSLLDFGPEGGDDLWLQMYQCIEFDPELRVGYRSIEVVDGHLLRLRGGVLDPGHLLGGALDGDGYVDGLEVETTYRSQEGADWIEIETTISNHSGRVFNVYDLCDAIEADGRGLVPFVPSPGWGTDLPSSDRITVPWLALGGDGAQVSYGLVAPEHGFFDLQVLGDRVDASRLLLVGTPSEEQQALKDGESRSWTRRLVARSVADTMVATDSLLELLQQAGGSEVVALGIGHRHVAELGLEGAGGRVTLLRLQPSTFVGASSQVLEGGVLPFGYLELADGETKRVTLPQGTYEALVEAPGRDEAGTELAIWGDGQVFELSPGDEAPLPLEVDFGGGVEAGPFRLTVVGLGGTPTPSLEGLVDRGLVRGNRVWLDGETSLKLQLPEGSYRLLASRGPAYDAAVAEVHLPTTDQLELELDGEPLEDGGVQLDPVVGSWASTQGGDAIEDVALALAGEGLEAWFRSETNRALPPPGDEPAGTGLLGTLDVPRADAPEGDGWLLALAVEDSVPGPGMRPADWLEAAAGAGALFTAVLGPRFRGGGGSGRGTFAAHDFDPGAGVWADENAFLRQRSAGGYRLLDVDAIEVLTPRDPHHVWDSVLDWFAFLDGGLSTAPLAATESSYLLESEPGAARTVVLADDDSPQALASALAAGRLYVTSGPLLSFTAQGEEGQVGPGETATPPSGRLWVHIQVSAADWVPVERVVLWVNGEAYKEWDFDDPGGEQRFDRSVKLESLEPGSWVVVQVGEPEQEPGGTFSELYPGMPAFALSAPIWVGG